MSYTLTTDWDSIQERNIDPHSPRTSENHNKLLKVMSKHKAYISGLNLSFIHDTTNNRIVGQITEGIVILNYMCIEFKEKPTFILFECPINEQDFYIVVEYNYSVTLPNPFATIKVIPTSTYNPDVHLRLYFLHVDNWDNIPTELEFKNWISTTSNFKDYRYEAESLPEWAVNSFLLKRGDEILGVVLTPDPTLDMQVANKKYVDSKLVNINLDNYVKKDGDMMLGSLTLFEHPDTSSYQPLVSKKAATKGYVDYWVNHMITALGEEFASGPYLPIAGGVLTGDLILNRDPISNLQAATKQYVDDNISSVLEDVNELETTVGDLSFLPLAGGIMEGYINLHADPIYPPHAATKQYVDDTLENGLSTKSDIGHTHIISHVTSLQDVLNGKSDVSHTHDSRYYTESEIDTMLAGLSGTYLRDTGHYYSTNGYQKFSNGFILQWGYVSVPGDSYTNVTFPMAFPNNCLSGQASHTGGGGYVTDAIAGFQRLDRTKCRIHNGLPWTATLSWFAIGY